ncbi:hypothetical protein C9374_002980 [Naegleria lovaniensis]|uniref:Uncharacterized protein n=1 Tax=Naegleria lovaniensis TaxID=51637 RepID=A0AA88GPB3_NAELO|nr:uncharacterized protein C9374_002980 [Naegleria lovaniensis]KAG2385831.1 hypothetical protein C9374_002980 [Naegleria lovaniensis]
MPPRKKQKKTSAHSNGDENITANVVSLTMAQLPTCRSVKPSLLESLPIEIYLHIFSHLLPTEFEMPQVAENDYFLNEFEKSFKPVFNNLVALYHLSQSSSFFHEVQDEIDRKEIIKLEDYFHGEWFGKSVKQQKTKLDKIFEKERAGINCDTDIFVTITESKFDLLFHYIYELSVGLAFYRDRYHEQLATPFSDVVAGNVEMLTKLHSQSKQCPRVILNNGALPNDHNDLVVFSKIEYLFVDLVSGGVMSNRLRFPNVRYLRLSASESEIVSKMLDPEIFPNLKHVCFINFLGISKEYNILHSEHYRTQLRCIEMVCNGGIGDYFFEGITKGSSHFYLVNAIKKYIDKPNKQELCLEKMILPANLRTSCEGLPPSQLSSLMSCSTRCPIILSNTTIEKLQYETLEQ